MSDSADRVNISADRASISLPYAVDSVAGAKEAKNAVVAARTAGLEFYLDPSMVEVSGTDRVRAILADALAALDKLQPKAAG